MGRVLKNVGFDEWLEFVFEHPVTKPAWHWNDDADEWGGKPVETVGHLKKMLLESGACLKSFSDDQLNQGFWYLISGACSETGRCLTDESVPPDSRKSCILAIENLFRDCFMVRCSNHLSHLDEHGANPLNSICYMWWDVLPVCGCSEDTGRRETDSLFLGVMERTLKLESEACRESALHGLGEWHCFYPEKVQKIIEDFIWSNRKIRDSLRNYAYAAMHGDVL